MNASKKCWALTDGSVGMIHQAQGLGEAMGFEVERKDVKQHFPWKNMAPFLRLGKRWCIDNKHSSPLTAPWPQLIIACGRRSILPALALKEKSQHALKVIYIQNPLISPHYFDAVVMPQHDRNDKTPLAQNVFFNHGALHKVTPKHLLQGEKDFANLLATPKRPRVGVLLGGPTKRYQFDQSVIEPYIKSFEALIQQGCALFITPSRRTDPGVVARLKQTLGHQAYIWDGTGDNPYFAILNMDYILVTGDSISMISEACSTDKPVYILELPGHNKRFQIFYNYLLSKGRCRFWKGSLENFSVTPLNETQDIADQLKAYLDLK